MSGESDNNTDPRFDAINATLRALQEQNAAIVANMSNFANLVAGNAKPAQAQEPDPEITGQEFLENPTQHLRRLMEKSTSRITFDLQKQMEPLIQYMTASQRKDMANDYIAQMESNGSYTHISNPKVKAFVREAIMNAPQVNAQFVNAVYFTAIGQLVASGGSLDNNEPKKEEKKEPKKTPAYMPPSGSGKSNSESPASFTFDENQNRLIRERGWSQARAAYMFEMISPEQYKKLEPEGKLIDLR